MGYTPDQRAEAVALCLEVGMAEAHNRNHIPKPTMSRWMTDDQREEMAQRFQTKTQRATDAAKLRWQDRRADLLHRLGEIAELAVDQSEKYLLTDDPRKAKDAATTGAIYIDKAQVLSGDANQIHKGFPFDSPAWKPVLAQAVEDGERIRPHLVTDTQAG